MTTDNDIFNADPAEARVVSAKVAGISTDLAEVILPDGTAAVLPLSATSTARPLTVGGEVLVEVIRDTGRPVVSASSPEVVSKQMEAFVPELRDGTVRVIAVAREAGVRTKVVVAPTVEGVDAQAACVGKAGSRIRNISKVIGERVDIVLWSSDFNKLASAALGPVEFNSVKTRGDVVTVHVPSNVFQSAIGRQAMNVKLVSALLGKRVVFVEDKD